VRLNLHTDVRVQGPALLKLFGAEHAEIYLFNGILNGDNRFDEEALWACSEEQLARKAVTLKVFDRVRRSVMISMA
jgi:hypothetical protein